MGTRRHHRHLRPCADPRAPARETRVGQAVRAFEAGRGRRRARPCPDLPREPGNVGVGKSSGEHRRQRARPGANAMTRRCIALLLLGFIASPAPRNDANGVWSGQVKHPSGEAIDLVLNLSATGTALTGTAAAAPDDSAFTIENGRIEGAHLSFEIGRNNSDGDSVTFSVTATIAGNQMKGSVVNRREGVTLPFTLTRNRSGRAAARQDNGPGRRNVSHAPAGAEPPAPKGTDPVPVDARKAVLAAFADHEVVGLGILSYANQDFDNFILSLLRDPAFPETVNDIVVECGNSLYQPVLDRYIAGQDVPLSEARNVWRNTTQPMCGLSAFYEELFPLVRQLNQALPAGKRLRVLAGDPPIDWGKVRNADDTRAF